ncbi:Zinc finger protein 235, partial [Araneus ventricosus]
MKHEIIMVKATDSEMSLDEIRRVEMNRYPSKNVQNLQKYLTKSQLSKSSHNFSIRKAEPCQRLIPIDMSTVNPIHESAAYTDLIRNRVKLNSNNVQKITGKCNIVIILFKFVSNFTVLFISQEETAAKGTERTEKSELSGGCSKNLDLAVAVPSRLHFNERNFPAPSNEFRSQHDLKQQYMVFSSGIAFTCDICRKGFTQSDELKEHMLTHKGEKPYKCSVYKKAFKRKDNLDRHMRIQSGDTPCNCEFYEKSFLYKCGLQTRFLIHTGDKPHVYEICVK